MADAWHHRSDAFSSVGSFIGIGGAMIGFPVLDPIASVIIALCILKVAFDILKDALSKMMDKSLGDEFNKSIEDIALENKNVKSVDLIKSRMFGNKIYIDLEIALDGSKSLSEAHAIAENIHDEIEKNNKDIKHVMIHVNPAI